MKSIREIEAKLKLLTHLQKTEKVSPEVIAGAKAKLGSDLCDALSGTVGATIQQDAEGELARLQGKNFRKGDRLVFEENADGDTQTGSVESVMGEILTIGPHRHRRAVAECKSAELESLRELIAACDAARR